MNSALQTQLTLFSQDEHAAVEAIHVGESAPKNSTNAPETAAWTMISNLILNLDEAVTRN